MASRHLSRSIVMQSLYEWDFYEKKEGALDVITERNIKDFGPGLEDLEFVRSLIHGWTILLKKPLPNGQSPRFR